MAVGHFIIWLLGLSVSTNQHTFFDIRIINPYAPSNRSGNSYRQHENMKRREYEMRVWEVEHGNFSPLFRWHGCLYSVAYKCLAFRSCLVSRKLPTVRSVMSWLRCHLGFTLAISHHVHQGLLFLLLSPSQGSHFSLSWSCTGGVRDALGPCKAPLPFFYSILCSVDSVVFSLHWS